MIWMRWVSGLSVLALLSSSCVGEVDVELDRFDIDEAEDEMQRRMNVQLSRDTDEGTVTGEATSEEFAGFIRDECVRQLPDHCPTAPTGTSFCSYLACTAEVAECVANELLNYAGDEPDTIMLPEPFFGEWRVPPQSAATKAGLATQAYWMARGGAATASVYFQYTAFGASVADCGTNPTFFEAADGVDEILQQEATATALRSTLDLAEEALDKAQQWTLAVADAQHSDQASIDTAAQQALLLSIGSRSALAHYWVGGDTGIAALTQVRDEGFCPDARLSPEGRKAEELIRMSGIDPVEVLNEGDLGVFVDQLLPRLADVLEAPQLETTSREDFYEGFGLNAQAFLEARTHVADEYRAFGRDLRATLTDVPGVDGPASPYFAATANPPAQPLRSYWSALAAFDASFATVSTPPEPIALNVGDFPRVDGATGMFDAALTTARWLTTFPSLEPTAQGVIQELSDQQRARREGRLQVCVEGGTSGVTRVRYLSDQPEDGLAVVLGHGGLQCAVRGAVEGAPCDLDDYRLGSEDSASFTTSSANILLGVTWDHGIELPGVDHPDFSHHRNNPLHEIEGGYAVPIFLVRQRSANGPGGFEQIGGVMLPVPDDSFSGHICRTVSIVSEMDEKAQESLAPSTTYCAMSAATCAGIPLDQRLPLENELISDGDAFESSWRHYLNLARETADHADRLGEDLIRAGLEMDMRGEQAIDELEDLCGVSLNVTELGAQVPAGTDPVDAALALLDDADQARLVACLGSSATIDWVTLGHKPLCFSWDGSRPDTICDGASNCPSSTDEDTCAGDPATTARAEPLGFFELTPEAEAQLAADEGQPPPCAQLASIRGATTTREDRLAAIEAVLSHPMFERRDQLQQYANQLGWRAYPGDYSTVTLNDGTWLGTGSYLTEATDIPSMPWPCDGPSNANTCMDGVTPSDANPPLFCNQLPASACPTLEAGSDPYSEPSRIARARMNDMMARAVLAAKMVAGVPLNNFAVPYYPRIPSAPFHKVGVTNGDAPFEPFPWADYDARPITRQHLDPISGAIDTIYTSQGAVLRIDKNGDMAEPVDVGVFDMGRGEAYYVANRGGLLDCSGGAANNAGIEWLLAPYDHGLSYLEIFDDEPDCDDVADSALHDLDLPLIVRGMDGDAASGLAVSSVLEEMWSGRGGDFSGFIRAALSNPDGVRPLGPTTPGIERLTRYWRRASTSETGLAGEFFAMWEDLTGICFSNLDPTDEDGCRETVGCHRYYEDCRQAMGEGEDFDSTLDGNRAFIAGAGLTGQDVLNGMELLCAAAEDASPSGYDCSEPVEIHTVGDLFGAQGFLECQADAIRNKASTMLLRDMPSQVVELLGTGGTSSTSGAGVSGELAAATDELRAALIELSDTSTQIGATVDGMAAAVGALRSRAQQMSIKSEIGRWQLASTTLNQVTTCVAKVSEAAGGTNVGAGVAAGAVCGNAAAQIVIAARITSLSEDLDEAALREALYRFEQEFNGAVAGLSGADTRLRASTARIEAAITRIKNLQRRGRRALARALMLDSAPEDGGVEGAMGRRYFVNTSLRRRMNTLRVRYEEAQRNAVKTAFLAKLALEQRLGMGLDEMTDPLTLIEEAPAGWHMDVCSMSGIDYDRIRDSTTTPAGDRMPGEGVDVPEDYAGEYVGDYVRKLALVFESYSVDFPFQDGTDTTVLSLRDEIWNVRAACDADTPNLLFEAGQLDQRLGERRAGWSVEGCASIDCSAGEGCFTGTSECIPGFPCEPDGETDCSTGEPICVLAGAAAPRPSCVSAVPLETSPIPVSFAEAGVVPGFEILFGVDDDVIQSRTSDTQLVQWMEEGLQPGRYRLSWYQRVDGTDLPAIEVLERRQTYDSISETFSTSTTTIPFAVVEGGIEPNDGWARHYAFFDVRLPTQAGVSIRPQMPGEGFQRVQVGALMLEDVTDTVVGSLSESVPVGTMMIARSEAAIPPLFFNTTQSRARTQRVCTDTDGSAFRSSAWTRHCLGLCPDGYGDCPGALEQHCFYETSFTLDPERLQRQGILDGAGFAFGNFNYRVERVGINVVGTNVRDCESTGGGATCYASGNVAYSVVHDGPYPVRNHAGGLFDAPLFRGRVERARALAAERYLSNPLSGADRALVEPYLRRELVGRPLSGTYTLRIWDDPALAWSNVEDIQLMLNYRYWTRQE